MLHPKNPVIEVFFPRHRLRALRKCWNARPFGRGVSLILMSGFQYILAYYLLVNDLGIPEGAPLSGKSVDERGDLAMFSF
jgi:hypothetical protein